MGVLSLAGSEDGLSTPQKVADARHLLPTDAELVEIAGASHSCFGHDGLQPGDNTPTIADDDMTAQLTENISGVFVVSLRFAGSSARTPAASRTLLRTMALAQRTDIPPARRRHHA